MDSRLRKHSPGYSLWQTEKVPRFPSPLTNDSKSSSHIARYLQFAASIRRTAAKLTSDWSSGLDFPLNSFLSIYSPNIEWYDHAYHLRLIGHGALANLRKGWIGANEGLKIETKA